MARRGYRYVPLRCDRGINEEADLNRPGECAAALNLWAPDGRVQTRPGYWPHAHMHPADDAGYTVATGPVVVQERINSAPTGFTNWAAGYTSIASGANLVAGDRVYLGFADVPADFMALNGEFNSVSNTDTSCTVDWTYYNGSAWVPLAASWVAEGNGRIADVSANFLVEGPLAVSSVVFTMPTNAAQVDVNSSGLRYWLRATIIDGTVVGTVDLDVNTLALWPRGDVELSHYGVIELGNGKWHVRASNAGRNDVPVLVSEANIGDRPGQRTDWLPDIGSPDGVRLFTADEPGTIAGVPAFGEAFASCFGRRMVEYGPRVNPQGGLNSPIATVGRARVEYRDFAVGDKAPFDRQYIAQETAFPRARYLLNFKGLLWAAGIRDEPHTIRWSAPVPYHRVWPSLSFERVMEDDDSPITGLAALQEQVVVFKRDSIWLMLPVGANAFGLSEFVPTRIVAGVGCVSNSSIQRVRGRLVFLAEDGVYAFDGTPSISKVTENLRRADRLVDTFKRVTKPRRPWASAVNWKAEECYLLGISLDGSLQNTHTVVWDYGTDSWWLWDIPAQRWFKTEDSADEEEIWFVRADGAICRLGGRTDNYATISSSVTTHRLRYADNLRAVFRTVEVLATNKVRELTVQVIPDEYEEAFSSATVDYSDYNEALWSGTVTSGDATAANSTGERRLGKRLGVRAVADYVQVKVAHSQNNQQLKFTHIDCGFLPLGRR